MASSCIIPADVLQEIFYRLPLKSIACFKSVCKGWYSLLSHPHFNRTFRQLSGDQLLVFAISFESLGIFKPDKIKVKYENLIKTSDIEKTKFECPDPEWGQTWKVAFFGSSNGLVAAWIVFDDEFGVSEPKNGMNQSPPVSPTRFDHPPVYEAFHAYIVSLKTGRCTRLDHRSAFKHRMINRHCENEVGTVVCGVPHWLIQLYDFKTPLVQKEIFYFDQEKGRFSQMALPHNVVWDGAGAGEKHLLGLGALDGQKQLGILLQRIDYGLELEVWVMKEYGKAESWNNMFTISTLNLTKSVRFVHLLGFMPKGELCVYDSYSTGSKGRRIYGSMML